MNNIIDFAHDYILEDDRVLLRPLQMSDFAHLLSFSEAEPELWKFSLLSAAGRDNLQQYLQIAVDARHEKKEYPFIVFDKKENKYAGSTRFYDVQPAHGTLQLGYTWYGKDYQRTGLNRHCKWLLLQFAFETLNMERVELRADNNNARSIAAMKAIGGQVDGILRSNILKPDGLRRDSIVLSILKEEWFGSAREILKKMVS